MLNLAMLFMSGTKKQTLQARVKGVVTKEEDGDGSYSIGLMSNITLVEGNLDVATILDNHEVEANMVSTSQMVIYGDVSWSNPAVFTLENENSGKHIAITFLWNMETAFVYTGAVGLFSDSDVGKECVIAIYA